MVAAYLPFGPPGNTPFPAAESAWAEPWPSRARPPTTPASMFTSPTAATSRTLAFTNWCGAPAAISLPAMEVRMPASRSRIWATPFASAALITAWRSKSISTPSPGGGRFRCQAAQQGALRRGHHPLPRCAPRLPGLYQGLPHGRRAGRRSDVQLFTRSFHTNRQPTNSSTSRSLKATGGWVFISGTRSLAKS